jgi:hypothetical protein
MKTTRSKTDLVIKMRAIRDKFSTEIMDMSFEQEREYIQNQLAKLKIKSMKPQGRTLNSSFRSRTPRN